MRVFLLPKTDLGPRCLQKGTSEMGRGGEGFMKYQAESLTSRPPYRRRGPRAIRPPGVSPVQPCKEASQEMLQVDTPWLLTQEEQPQEDNAKGGESWGESNSWYLLKGSPTGERGRLFHVGTCGLGLPSWWDFLPAVSLHFKQPLEMASPLLLPVLATQNVFVPKDCRGGVPAHGPSYFQTQQEDGSLGQKNKPESSPSCLASLQAFLD